MMTNNNPAILFLASVLACACAREKRGDSMPPGAEATPAAVSPSNETEPTATSKHNPSSPVTAKLLGPAQVPATGSVVLVLELERANTAVGPISINLRLPTGIVVQGDAVDEKIVDTSQTRFKRQWTIRYPSIPTDDLLVIVDWRTSGAGFHAELPWRFGRPEAKGKEPAYLPGEVRLPTGESIGTPILSPSGPKTP